MSDPIKSKELETRLLDLSVETIKTLQADKLSQPIKDQLIRSITSIGANYMEANNASSKADFRAKIFIVKKETAESLYWIEIILKLSDNPRAYLKIQDELAQLIKIFQRIVSTLKNGSANEK